MSELTGSSELIDFTNISSVPDVILGENYQARDEFTSMLKKTSPGTLLLDGSEFMSAQGDSLTSSFTEYDEFGEGRKCSMNNVYFGELVLRASNAIFPEHVAVKPHTMSTESDSIVHEWAGNNFMNSMSTDEAAYVPLGVWRDASGMYQLVTVYDHKVRSFDNVFWVTDEAASTIDAVKIEGALSICMQALGCLQGVGAVHQDAQVKNLAQDRNRIRFIDLETIELLDRIEPQVIANSTNNREKIHDELNKFVSSCIGFGHIDDLIIQSMRKPEVRKHAYQQYLEGLLKTSSRVGNTFPVELQFSRKDIDRAFNNAEDML